MEEFDKAKKKDLLVNKPKDDKDQANESAIEEYRCIELREHISP